MNSLPQYNEISHYHNRVKHTSRSKVIYSILLLSFLLFIASIFFVAVDVSIQSRGLITTVNKKSEVYNSAYGWLERIAVKENNFVNQGDTLYLLNTKDLEENWALVSKRISILKDEITDLKQITKQEETTVNWNTEKYKQQFQKFVIDKYLSPLKAWSEIINFKQVN